MPQPLQRAVAILNADYIEGATIEEVCASMCDLANDLGCYVRFVYEGIEMIVSFHHDAEYVLEEWRRRYYNSLPTAMNNYR